MRCAQVICKIQAASLIAHLAWADEIGPKARQHRADRARRGAEGRCPWAARNRCDLRYLEYWLW